MFRSVWLQVVSDRSAEISFASVCFQFASSAMMEQTAAAASGVLAVPQPHEGVAMKSLERRAMSGVPSRPYQYHEATRQTFAYLAEWDTKKEETFWFRKIGEEYLSVLTTRQHVADDTDNFKLWSQDGVRRLRSRREWG